MERERKVEEEEEEHLVVVEPVSMLVRGVYRRNQQMKTCNKQNNVTENFILKSQGIFKSFFGFLNKSTL